MMEIMLLKVPTGESRRRKRKKKRERKGRKKEAVGRSTEGWGVRIRKGGKKRREEKERFTMTAKV